LAELSKLDGTYYKGMININKEMNWPENKIHGQFNQCVAATGRLSSSKPNLQNFAGDCQDIFVSRYGSS
jgi:DNA polymerase-1